MPFSVEDKRDVIVDRTRYAEMESNANGIDQ